MVRRVRAVASQTSIRTSAPKCGDVAEFPMKTACREVHSLPRSHPRLRPRLSAPAQFKFVAASAVAAVAVAQTPAQPRWPQEFTATITHSDNHNHTDVINTMFSVQNNAVQDSFTDPRGNKGLDLHDYAQHRDYMVFGTQCREQPERGSIQDRIPDLRRVTYNKTDTFNGQSVYGTVSLTLPLALAPWTLTHPSVPPLRQCGTTRTAAAARAASST